MHIRDATPADFAAILALNQAFAAELSSLDEARLAHLHAQAAQHRVIERDGDVLAFLLTLREGSDYDSPNYQCFAARYPRFLYVDRIVVSASAQGLGAGRQLYRDAYQHALGHALPVLVCEYDIARPIPPRRASTPAWVFAKWARKHWVRTSRFRCRRWRSRRTCRSRVIEADGSKGRRFIDSSGQAEWRRDVMATCRAVAASRAG